MSDLVVSDGEIERITSVAGSLEIVFKDWKEDRWLILIDELIAFESLGAEGETLGEIVVEDESEFKSRVFKMLPDESVVKSKVFIFKSAWSGLSVLQAIGVSLEARII
nr:hypothetical protein [uncultured Pseudomonas sp.]